LQVVMFYHSLVSDWNHGNAHFLRGIASELLERGHKVHIYEPGDGWSRQNLIAEHGHAAIAEFKRAYPKLRSNKYDLKTLDLNRILDGADLVLVHEWNDHELVRKIGRHRAKARSYRLLFHDTHHRAVTDSKTMAAYDLSNYDGVLAYGKILRDLYLKRGWSERAWTWHEAADTRVFHPIKGIKRGGDLIWIGNWGDEERTEEIYEFLLKPAAALGLKSRVHGVRYPESAIQALQDANIEYGDWLPNYKVPSVFARFKVTVHITRRPYTRALPGIPTIRPFEALACGIPLISTPWDDVEGLFQPGLDFLVAHNGNQMRQFLKMLINDKSAARALAKHGRQTVLSRHTCADRVNKLMNIYAELEGTAQRKEMVA